MIEISSIKALIKCWPSRKDLADDLVVSKERVDKWAQTASIPARFHARLIRAGNARGISVTADLLARLHDGDNQEDAA
jgi:DNA-binding transcriptional regulator YiaG